MNYPIQELAIIAPILFIVLMVAFPLIGVFGGWKRAAYWGGGNFVFYCIGLLVWTFAGSSIGAKVADLIKPMLSGMTSNIDKIATSFAAPVFYLAVMLVGNLILLINYYAWFKRVAGLKKWKIEKKVKKNGEVVKTKIENNVQLSTKGKVVNKVVGGVGMTLLMAPSIFSFTQFTYFATTSYSTRANNGFSSAIYNFLNGVNEKMNWLSYYKTSAEDFDGLWGALAATSKKINYTKVGESEQSEVTIVEALEDLFGNGFGTLFEETAEGGESETVLDTVEKMTTSWNDIVKEAGNDITPIFESANATEIIKEIIPISDEPLIVTQDIYENYIENFIENVDAYKEDTTKTLPLTIDISQESFDNLKTAFDSYYELGEGVDQQEFDECLDTLLQLFFNPTK